MITHYINKSIKFLIYLSIIFFAVPFFCSAYVIDSTVLVTGNSEYQSESDYPLPNYLSGWFLHINGLHFSDLENGKLYYLPAEGQSCDLGSGGFNVNNIDTGQLVLQFLQSGPNENGFCEGVPSNVLEGDPLYSGENVITSNGIADFSLKGSGIVYFGCLSAYCNTGFSGEIINNGSPYFTLTSSSSDEALEPDIQIDETTRIISFTPEDNSTVTGPFVDFTLSAYINSVDLIGITGIKITLHNIDQNVLLLGVLSPSDIYLVEQEIQNAGIFEFATTTVIADGNYRLEACLTRSYLGGWLVNPFSNVVAGPDCQSHQFIVGEETFIGSISQKMFDETNVFFASSTATSSQANAVSCNPLSGSFDIRQCLAFLFIPSAKEFQYTFEKAKEGILIRVPFGYLTRTATILSSTATSSLPSFTANIQIGGGEQEHATTTAITYDMNDMIMGGGVLLDSVRDPIHGKSVRDIFYPLIQLIVAIGVVWTIVADLSGSHKNNDVEINRRTKQA